jgi:type II secretory pathway pseudopilin PulG
MKKLNRSIPKVGQMNRHGGFALTELLFAIGIVALILGAVAAIAITTSGSQTAQSEARIIDSAANKIRTIYNSRADFNGLDNAASISIQAWPSNMVSGTAGIFNSWGGDVDVVEGTGTYAGQDAARLFEISSGNVSENSCADMATASTSAIGVQVGGTDVYTRGSATLDPVDATGAATACSEGETITFIYGKNG